MSDPTSGSLARTDVPEEWREPMYMYLEQHLPLKVLE